GAVEAHDALDFGGADADDLCDLRESGFGDVPLVVLHFPQERHYGAAPAVGGVAAEYLPQQLLLVCEVWGQGAEFYHLSTSPRTGSSEAMFMTMSANSPPTQAASSACRLMRLGTRTFTR